jgi:hypothetical protein
MPISRTVSGLKYEVPLDKLNEVGRGGYSYTHFSIDSETKQEGSGSLLYNHTNDQVGYPTYAWVEAGVPDIETGDRFHIWHKAGDSDHQWKAQVKCLAASGCTLGDVPYYVKDIVTCSDEEDWTLKRANVPTVAEAPGNRVLYVSRILCTKDPPNVLNDWVDRCVISTSQYLTVTGLNPGQKIEVYRSSDDAKIVDGTCGEGETQVILDIDDQDYPLYCYLKFYATDGATLIEATTNQKICGGDTWYWVPPYGSLTMDTTAFVLVRSGGTGTPKEATITATLKTPAEEPAPGKTIYFTTSKGSVTPSSDVTDENGEAQTVLTSDTHGIAVVKANWPGDVDIPAAVGYATHQVLYDEEIADSSKKFQLFIEGIEYSYSKGSYSLASVSDPQEFSVQIPEWLSTITKRGLVSIYRLGVKEYSGVLTKIRRVMSESPNRELGGTDSESLLETRVVTLKDYSEKTVAYILDDLLDSHPCGVTLGTIGDYPALTITFADETLVSSISRLCDVIGWLYRVNADNSLDVKDAFGSSKSTITFTEGVNLFLADNTEDYTQISNSIRMRGNELLVSTAFDGASIEDIGLIEDVVFQKSIGDQGTLDIAALAELARRVTRAITITAGVLDDYDVGSWGVDDWVTLTCEDVELSGTYKVVKITRDMTDPRFASVDFANKAAVELGDLFDRLKRELKDLSAKTAI